MTEDRGFLPSFTRLGDYFDYFDGLSVRTIDDLVARQLRDLLLKTYMFETVGGITRGQSITQALQSLDLELTQIDADAWTVRDPKAGGSVALLESVNDRYHALYSLLPSDRSDAWARWLGDSSAWLDSVWLAAPFFEALWGSIQATFHPRRYARLAFEHEALFERQDDDEDSQNPERMRPGDREEHRSSRFTMVDRVEVLQASLPALQELYRPLYSITQLRIPGASRGGHDFYYDGKVTNRSDSFADHRLSVRFVLNAYASMTEAAESLAWLGRDVESGTFSGAPVYMSFGRPLEPAVFDRWMAALTRKNSRFKLAGRPIRMGPNKVHLYGIDRHLWQPIQMEITRKHLVAFLPRGTCGNTVNRLIATVQRFVDPSVEAWIGDSSYRDLAADALRVRS